MYNILKYSILGWTVTGSRARADVPTLVFRNSKTQNIYIICSNILIHNTILCILCGFIKMNLATP